MTRDETIRMAQEAGVIPPGWGATEMQWRSLDAFAVLVATNEREACAQACDKYDDADPLGVSLECANAIRARNQA
jgi:hypothetical protein